MTYLSTTVNFIFCSHQFCILPSQHIIVESPATPLLPAFCIHHQVFLPQEYRAWRLHLLLSLQASRIWWLVLLELQVAKTCPSHPPHHLLLVSCLVSPPPLVTLAHLYVKNIMYHIYVNMSFWVTLTNWDTVLRLFVTFCLWHFRAGHRTTVYKVSICIISPRTRTVLQHIRSCSLYLFLECSLSGWQNCHDTLGYRSEDSVSLLLKCKFLNFFKLSNVGLKNIFMSLCEYGTYEKVACFIVWAYISVDMSVPRSAHTLHVAWAAT